MLSSVSCASLINAVVAVPLLVVAACSIHGRATYRTIIISLHVTSRNLSYIDTGLSIFLCSLQ